MKKLAALFVACSVVAVVAVTAGCPDAIAEGKAKMEGQRKDDAKAVTPAE